MKSTEDCKKANEEINTQSKTLVVISGPSGVGKGPLMESLKVYLSAQDKKLCKHVLYTDRELRDGEVDGVDYHFRTTNWLKEEEERNKLFKTFELPSQLQGIDFGTLAKEMDEYYVVFLEIFYERVPNIKEFCRARNIITNSVFVTPLSENDYNEMGCGNVDFLRTMTTYAIMRNKLINRGTDKMIDITKRAGKAYTEIKEHIKYDYDHDLVNPYGEDNRYFWRKLCNYLQTPNDGLQKALQDSTIKGLSEVFERFIKYLKL